MRSVVGSLSWIARQGRPDLLYRASRLQANTKVHWLKEANEVLELALEGMEDVKLRFPFHLMDWDSIGEELSDLPVDHHLRDPQIHITLDSFHHPVKLPADARNQGSVRVALHLLPEWARVLNIRVSIALTSHKQRAQFKWAHVPLSATSLHPGAMAALCRRARSRLSPHHVGPGVALDAFQPLHEETANGRRRNKDCAYIALEAKELSPNNIFIPIATGQINYSHEGNPAVTSLLDRLLDR